MARPVARGSTAIALAGTLVVHAGAAAFLYAAGTQAKATLPPAYRVRLVAAPEPDPAARRAPEAVDRPAESAVPPAPTRRTPPRNTAAKTPAPSEADTREREAAPRTTPRVAPLPGEKPSTGDDVATVSTEGIEFPYPEYLENIVSQVLRRWQRPDQRTPLEAEVAFFIHRDGTVTDLRFIRRSGNFAFDLEAQGAIEEAGRFRAFGDLPPAWGSEVLFVRFYFSGQR